MTHLRRPRATRAHYFMPRRCLECQAVGTIVEMGACCRIAALIMLDACSKKFRLLDWRSH